VDDTGPVRSLRQIGRSHTERPHGPPGEAGSDPGKSLNFENKAGITAPPVVASGSHGSGGDDPIAVLYNGHIIDTCFFGKLINLYIYIYIYIYILLHSY
jgi:hypothetical protein